MFKLEILDAFNDAGTFGAFGFLGAYFLISIAAPAYLSKRGELGAARLRSRWRRSCCCWCRRSAASTRCRRGGRLNIFPYIFLGYLAIGMVWFMISAPQSRLHRQRQESRARRTWLSSPVRLEWWQPQISKPARRRPLESDLVNARDEPKRK